MLMGLTRCSAKPAAQALADVLVAAVAADGDAAELSPGGDELRA